MLLRCSTDITDQSLISLAECCPTLNFLFMANNNFKESNNLTDIGIVKIAECCPKLEILNIRGFANVTDLSIIMLQYY
jgi:hypothetical protein